MTRPVIWALACVLLTAAGCPTCPPDGPFCHELIRYTADVSGNCPCETCLTKCSYRRNICPAGKLCQEQPVIYNMRIRGYSAVCVPFTSCPSRICNNTCPKTGFLFDPNECNTCLCVDPCVELDCQSGTSCTLWANITGTDPEYGCKIDE